VGEAEDCQRQQRNHTEALYNMERTLVRRQEAKGSKRRGSCPSLPGYQETPAKKEKNGGFNVLTATISSFSTFKQLLFNHQLDSAKSCKGLNNLKSTRAAMSQ
jgi:hypothetical protein